MVSVNAKIPPKYRHLPCLSFGDTPQMADELVRLVLTGRKTATCWPFQECELDDPALWIICDGSGEPRCVVETVEIMRRRFDEVDEAFAYDEGEGDRTLQYWRSS